MRSNSIRSADAPAMTFTEIGKALGCTTEAARLTYNRAIAKLRRRPEGFKVLRALLYERSRLRREVIE